MERESFGMLMEIYLKVILVFIYMDKIEKVNGLMTKQMDMVFWLMPTELGMKECG